LVDRKLLEEPIPTVIPPPSTPPPPVDCSIAANDPSCGNNANNPKCLPDTNLECKTPEPPKPPITCQPDEVLVNDKCQKIPDTGTARCPEGFHNDGKDNCIPDKDIICPEKAGFTVKVVDSHCDYTPIPPPKCNKDTEKLVNGKCEKITCPLGFHLQKGVCTRTIIKHVTTVETVVRNFVTTKPTFPLLLDTAQLCQLAGDTQCVAKQNQFDTLNLVTKLSGNTWSITGQVENRVSKIQRNVQVTAYFYDSKGNNVGGPYKGTVNPTVLKRLQLGAFSMKPSTSIMKGTPSFIRLEYQSSP
jgi:hypothetical protein